ncbi:hypothetical protein HY639_04300 [Candidatus Woesearchaeota archaeon]|nr:hypothetical protein [Candidatus Woesearchaeota archaeon]
MALLYLAILAVAYLLLLFWIVFAVKETTRKYVAVPLEMRHISVKRGRKKRYVMELG